MKKEYTFKQDGFRAVWFEGTTNCEKVIIYMSGAGCGEEVTLEMSQYLVNNGYSVLCLGFYLWKGLPKKMYNIPVEYVERAVAELKRNGFDKIAIHGMSTGAGYALLCSSLIPDISCTIAVVHTIMLWKAWHARYFLKTAPYIHTKVKIFHTQNSRYCTAT